MLSAEGIGKNIEQAIENALFDLKASREDVDIKILSEGGLFKKAKVLVSISEDAKEKYEKKQTRKEKVEEPVKVEKAVKEDKKEVQTEKIEVVDVEMPTETSSIKESESVETDIEGMDPIEFLTGLFEVCGKQIEINITEDENYKTYSVVGENLGDMIGHRGDCYYAINRILAAVTGKQEKKVLLDIGGYREKRAETLTNLAKRTADRVAKSGRYARLDPMNPSDRRIVHSALSDDDRVVTLSKGEEPKRYVMVFPKDE